MNEREQELRIQRLEAAVNEIYRLLEMPSPLSHSSALTDAGHTASANPMGASDEVIEWVRAGKKIRAIKQHREDTGVGLAEAKEFVDRLDRQV
ncbi:ribosomal protein L7/L12 [uncultured Agrococcus sp.]|uniref:ribosomal protein L7/L12 n=1 Tax=uncultured Agrococcus sp. TaxID=382258 RepID=UPI0025DB3A27|nr:ribosomal protein L7/L12 [uncultured Agrococcus sp.]